MLNRKRIFEIIEKSEKGDIYSKIFDWFIIILISLNILAVVLESIQSVNAILSNFFDIFEFVSVIIFSIEIIFRLLTCDYKYPKKKFILSLIRYSLSFMAIIDFFAVIPFYLPFLFAIDLRFLRILRLIRIVRILKVQRYNKSLKLIAEVFKRKKSDLLISIFVTFLLLLFSSACMYFVEANAQPDKFPDILSSFWWAIATLTTVGYGDVFPITTLGKVLSGFIAFIGIGFVALPTGIISSGFIEIVKERQKKTCPHCGKELLE